VAVPGIDPYLILALVLGSIAAGSIVALMRAESRSRMQALRLEELSDGAVITLDGEKVLDCSAGAEALLGEVRGRSIGLVLEEFLGKPDGDTVAAIKRIIGDGTRLQLQLRDIDGKRHELVGKPSGGLIKLVFREAWTGLTPNQTQPARLTDDSAERDAGELGMMAFNAALSIGQVMIWHRDEDGPVKWSAGKVSAATGVLGPDDVLPILNSRPLRLSTGSNPDLPLARARLEVLPKEGNEKISLEVIKWREPDGRRIGFAVDASVAAAAEKTLTRFVQTMTETFAHLKVGLAIFDKNQTLALYNPALVRMWQIDPVRLAGQPSLRQIIDTLRSGRRIPDVPDYHDWRERLLKLFDNPEAIDYEELWHLSDGSSINVLARPHPHGSIAFIFDGVSERMQLEQRYRHSIDLRRVTLNRLDEGLAVFGPDGMLQFVNTAFHDIWGTDPEALDTPAHARDVIALCQGLTVEADVWDRLLSLVASDHSSRAWSARLTMGSGRILSARFATLPDGATMAVFADITDSERIALALRDRNEALEAVEEMRSAVLDQISHRLRTPLNTIFGFGQLLTDPRFGTLEGRQQEYASGILEASGHLLDTIDDVTERHHCSWIHRSRMAHPSSWPRSWN